MAAEWAPGLCDLIKTAIRRKWGQSRWRSTPGSQRRGALPQMASGPARAAALGNGLKQDEKASAAMWAAHYHAGHVPFRRDCAVCLEAAGRDRPRKSIPHPSAFTWSLDLMGPFVESHDQELPYARYGLVTVVTIPIQEELPVVRGLQELGARVPTTRKRKLPGWDEDESPQEDEVGAWEAPVDPWEEEWTEAETSKAQVLAKEWKEFLKDAQDVGEMRTLTFVQPVKSRSAKDILYGIMRIYARIQALQIPILRAHMDREKSFVSKEVTGWMAQKGLYCTYTAGDEPCGNARAEREIGVLRGRCRALMKSTNLDPGLWALAFRQAGEERLREQLWQVGVATPTLLPFGSRAMVKKKTWFQRADPWKWPMTPVTLLGPAGDMSLTSGGYYCRDQEGRFFRSTVVVIPKQHATTAQALEAELSRLQEVEDSQARNAHPVGDGLQRGGDGLQSGGDVDGPALFEAEAVQSCGFEDPGVKPWGAEDIFEAYQMRRQSAHESTGISQSVHESKRISQSAHEGTGISQSVHEDGQQLSQDAVMAERAEQDVLVVLDPPTRRIFGKSTPGQLLPTAEATAEPFLRSMRKGGEWTLGSQEMEMALAEEEELCEKLALWQHQRMKIMVQEEMAELLEGKTTNGWIPELVEETKAMEQALAIRARVKALAVPEVLQARTVPLEEVRKELELWKPAFIKEYETLTSGPVEVLTEEQYQILRDSGVPIEILPMKAVTVRKPDKYKARFVVCGNMAMEPCVEDTSVGGICTVALRCMVHKAALSKWSLGSIDVAGAFLQAPRRGEKTTLVEPPAILRQMGLCAPGEKWRVRCALYGFTESPSDWGHFRDETLRGLQWAEDGEEYRVEPTGEPHLWRIVKTSQEERLACGYLAIYVDDVLAAAEEKVLKSFFKAVKKLWRCSEEEMVSQDAWMRFCGYELKSDGEGGFMLSQEHYVRDLLNRRQVTGKEMVPLPKICEGEDEEMCGQALKEAQGVVGELQWISSRTRPDIAYGTGLLARMMHRRPRYTMQLAEHLLRYLRASETRSLRYRSGEGGEDLQPMVVSTDASFAPEHEQFRSVTGIIVQHRGNALQWVSMRQPFVSQSTCEAELIAFAEGFQDGESVNAVLQLLEVLTNKKLVGDCKAALSQITQETGPWRTRHLRLRAAGLRDAVKQGDWSIAHLPGAQLVADGGTKPLQGVAFREFVQRLGMEDVAKHGGDRGQVHEDAVEEAKVRSLWNQAELCSEGGTAMIGGGLALLCSDRHRRLAALLLTCGLLVKGWGGTQDRKRVEKDRNKDSYKDKGREPTKDSGSGTAKGNQQGVTGKPQEGSQVVTGEKTSEKNRKDPLWTMEPKSSDGSATPRVLVNRVTPQNPPQSGRSEEGKGRPLPGLRAMRKGSSSASHGDDGNSQRAGGGKGSAARGAAAMPLLEAQQTTGLREGDELRVHVAVSVTATGGQEEMRGYTSEEKPGPYPTRSTEETGRQVYEGVDRWKNFLDPKLLAKEHQQVPEARREGEPASLGGGSSGQDQGEPWERPIFSHVMTGKTDSWDQRWVGEGWLVRHHAKWRKRYFMPAHSTLPVEGKRLDFKRVSVRCLEDGTRLVEPGDWRDGARTADDRCWRGFTFIRLLDAAADGSGYNAASSTVAAASTALRSEGQIPEPEVSDDGSYELCP